MICLCINELLAAIIDFDSPITYWLHILSVTKPPAFLIILIPAGQLMNPLVSMILAQIPFINQHNSKAPLHVTLVPLETLLNSNI